MLEMAINNVEMGSELDRVHILTCCDIRISTISLFVHVKVNSIKI